MPCFAKPQMGKFMNEITKLQNFHTDIFIANCWMCIPTFHVKMCIGDPIYKLSGPTGVKICNFLGLTGTYTSCIFNEVVLSHCLIRHVERESRSRGRGTSPRGLVPVWAAIIRLSLDLTNWDKISDKICPILCLRGNKVQFISCFVLNYPISCT